MKKKNKSEEFFQLATDALFELMKTVNFEKITMEMIAKKSFISKRSLYRTFENKQKILNGFFQNLTLPLINQLQGIYQNNQQVIFTSFQFVLNNFEVLRVAHKNNLFVNLFSLIEQIVKQILICTSQKAVSSWSAEYLEYYVSFAAGGTFQVISKWLEKDCITSSEELFETYKNIVSDFSNRVIMQPQD